MKSKSLDFKGRTYTVFEDGKIIVTFNKNKVSSTDIIEFFMKNYTLQDFSLKETSIDDIIKKIYRKEV